MLHVLVLAAASVFAGPDPQTIFAQAALAWEARRVPDNVDWSLELTPRSPTGAHSPLSCTIGPGFAKTPPCNAPDGLPLFFDEHNDPFKYPPGSYELSLAGTESAGGKTVYHLTVVPRPQSAAASSPLRALWIGTDDFEVRKLTYGGATYAFEQYGSEQTWWTQRVDASWGTAMTASVRFSGTKTIANLRVTPLCSAVRSMVLPFLAIERSDRTLFADMDANVARFYDAAQVATDPGSPGLILARANLDWYAAQTYEHLAQADLLLKASYERVPQGTDPPLDAIRLRIQTLVDVERIATDDYASLAAPRETSYRYWNSVESEVARVRTLDGEDSHKDLPLSQAYGTDWLFAQLIGERREIVRPAMMAADYCGLAIP